MNHAVIVAAGTLKSFNDCRSIDEIIVVAQKNDFKAINEIKKKYGLNKIRNIVEGGKERQDSVHNGLISIKNSKNDDIIIIHNGSNPLVRENEIADCITAARQYGAAAVGFKLKDTIKKINSDFVEKTIDRKDVYQIQTPQAVKYGLLVKAFENAEKKKITTTDDASLVEALGKKVKIVQCSYENIKITTQDDLRIAEGILMYKKIENFLATKNPKDFLVKRNGISSNFRVGLGQDSHKFSRDKKKKLILGGYAIPNEAGLEANSDGDLILHALFNAISSAIGEQSLGFYSDPMCKKGITDSKEYLKVILAKMYEKNLKINNVSISIEAKKPRLEQHNDKIKDSLSRILKISKENIGITYSSGEGLTSFGKGEGMQCFAIVSMA
ncbi:2-C-methyl-D-erythritol 2,4-cyclodiphosphate synthase [Candidatus Woesearchaeota archaeon]|nr:2-C-methyl-D-erythritol 2,4-cyclodiphosphate synthase [Candidatus Woesearchaeota archaeon]